MLKWSVLIGFISLVLIAIVFSPQSEVVQLEEGNTLEDKLLESGQTRASSSTPLNNELPEYLQNSSLKGTQIDGLYPVDENGNLIISEDIKHRFEYFLSTMGEFSLDDVQKMILEDIDLNLSEPARSQAIKLFNDYIGYKYSLSELEAALQAPSDYELHDIARMRHQIEQLRDKRREYFDQQTIDAFFGFDELYDDFMINRLEIQASNELTQAEKAAQIASLEDSLPPNIREMREETEKVSRVFKLTESLKQKGASQTEIDQVNEQAFGYEAAQRLKQVEQQRQQWEEKVEKFISSKQIILANEALSESDKLHEMTELLSDFDENEQRRLKAYELMQSEPPN